MELGYFMMPLHHIDRDYHTTLEEDAEAIIFADELGYSEAWVGEHYTSAVEQITSPLQFLVAETDAEAEAFVKAPGGPYDFYYEYLGKIFERADLRAAFVVEKDDDPNELTHEALRDNLVIYGSPETVANRVLGLREKVGRFGTLLYAAHDWDDRKARMKSSMRLMAEEVMPRVNRALEAKAAAD